MVTDPDLMLAQASMQPVYYPEMTQGMCVDAKRPAYAYMAYFLAHTIRKT